MKKVREKLNEDYDKISSGSSPDMKRIADKSYRRIHREVTVYCEQVIKECGDILDRMYDEGGTLDEDEAEMTANNEGRIEIAQQVLEMLRNL